MNQRYEVDAEISVVRALLVDVAHHLSPSRLAAANELLRHHEPHEALLGIAWDLASQPSEVNEDIVREIREATGNSEDLPPSFRSAGPVG